MRAILEFNLSDAEQNLEFQRVVFATELASVIWDFDQYLRTQIKYHNKEHLQEVRDELLKFKEQYGVINLLENL